MAIKIFEFWKRNRPELDDALNFGENLADTTAATIGLAIALGVTNPVLGVAALVLPFAGNARRGIDYVVNRSNKKTDSGGSRRDRSSFGLCGKF